MKIPDAYFSGGFGQKVTPVQAPFIADASGAERIGQAGMRLGAVIAGAAADQIQEQGQIELQAAHARAQEAEKIRRENEAELKRLAQAQEHGAAQGALFAHQNTLQDVVAEIDKDTKLTPQEKKDQFRVMADQTRASFMESVPQQYQYAFAPSFDQHRYQAETSLDKKLTADIQTTIKAQLTNTLEDLKRSPRPLAEKLTLVADLDFAAAGFDEAQQAAAVQNFREGISAEAIDARLNRDDPRKLLKDLNRVDATGAHTDYTYLEPKTREAYIHTAKSRIEQLDREAEAERRRRASERNEAAKLAYEDYKDARQGLLTLDPKREASLWKAAQGTPYFERMRDVKKTTGGIDFLTKKISEDPLKFGAGQLGVVIPTLDASQPDTWPGQLQARGELAGKIKARHGLSYLPILTNDEAKGLAGYFGSQAPAGTVKALENFKGQIGSKSAGRMAQQFFAADPELGIVAGLVASGRSDAALKVSSGQRLIKEKALVLDTGLKKDMQATFDSQLGDAMAGLPQGRSAFFEAAKSAYVFEASRKGIMDSSLDKSLFREVVKTVIGETVKINGKKVMLPAGMPEGAFKDFHKRIDAEQIKQNGGVFGFADPAEAASLLRGDAKLLEAGEGRYRFTLDGKQLYKADGKTPFELEIGVHGGGW